MKKLFAELARRQVFRVTAAYSVVGWILLQIVGLLAPGLGLPEWTLTLVFTILAVGFPLAVLFAWAFELTPEGVSRTEAVDASEPRIKLADAGFLGVLVLVVIVSITMRPGSFQGPVSEMTTIEETLGPSRLAIAVLPFADMSPEGDQDWFSDGMSEEIIHRLALEKNLTVAGRTSSFYFKGKNVPFEAIGRMLNVGTVLEGSVRKDKNRVRITAQLIDIKSGAHRWSGTFDRELKDIFRIQEDLSVAIARELLRELGVEPTMQDDERYEPNVEAYQFNLRAREVYNAFQPQYIQNAALLHRKAADLDKGYVSPLSILLIRLAYANTSWIGPHNETLYGPDFIVAEALARNPPRREVLFIKASAAVANWQFETAERLYRERVELVGTADARWSLAALLTWTGRFREAIPILEKGVEAEPLNGLRLLVLSFSYLADGRYDDVITLTNRVVELGLPAGRILLPIKAHAAVAMNDNALYEKTKGTAAKVYGSDTKGLSWQIWDAQLDSDFAALKTLKNDLLKNYEQSNDGQLTSRIAAISALLGEEEAALKWYRRAVEARSYDFRLQMRFPREMSILLNTPEGRLIVEEAGYDAHWFEETEAEK